MVRYSKLNIIVLCMALILLILSTHQLLANETGNTIRITAKKFTYQPSLVKLKKGEPVILELVSQDRLHGFNIPELGIRADVLPGQTARLKITPNKTGTYTFMCDIFCGEDHSDMNGRIIVRE